MAIIAASAADTFEQARGFAKSVIADPESGLPGANESIREKARECLPRR